jgi:hypothetical protein
MYNYDGLLKKWESVKDYTLSLSTFYYIASNQDKSKYKKIRSKYANNIYDITEWKVGQIFKNIYSDRFISFDGFLYCWTGVFWQRDERNTIVHHTIADDLYDLLLTNLNENMKSNEKYVEYKKSLKCLQRESFRLHCINDIIRQLEKKDIKRDSKYNLFAFTNKIFDLNKKEFVTPCKDDYITITCGYDYREPDEKELHTVKKLMKSIFPNDEEYNYALAVASLSLEGRNSEKFVIETGNGGNGKGVKNEMLLSLVGEYGFTGCDAIIQGKARTGPLPEIANMSYKRLVVFSEPSTHTTLNTSIIKKLTGGNEINARECHSNNCKTVLHCHIVLECNTKPKLDDVGDSIYRRLIIIDYRSMFRVNSTEYKSTRDKKYHDLIHEADPKFKTNEFKDIHKFALFKILVDHYDFGKIPKEPHRLEKMRYSYGLESETIGQYITDNYILTDCESDCISLDSIFSNFKNSDYFENLTKQNKRDYGTRKKFEEYIESNKLLSIRYHPLRSSKKVHEQALDKKQPFKFLSRIKKRNNDDDDNDIDDNDIGDDSGEYAITEEAPTTTDKDSDNSDYDTDYKNEHRFNKNKKNKMVLDFGK